MRLDFVTWLEFLNHYNGITLFPERLWVSNDTLQFFFLQMVLAAGRGFWYIISQQVGFW